MAASSRPVFFRGVAQPGRAPALGAGSRQFESGRPDHLSEVVVAVRKSDEIFMSALYVATIKAFKNRGWHYREVPGRAQEVIETDFEAHHAKVPVHVQLFPDAHMASVVSRASFPFPPTHRAKVAELLMRTNEQLTLGNLEMAWDEGVVMFRVTNVFPANRYDEAILAAMVHAAVAEMDRLTPFLGEVCRTPSGELLLLKVKDLMAREDLLPPVPEEVV
jgi:hypothetical protein